MIKRLYPTSSDIWLKPELFVRMAKFNEKNFPEVDPEFLVNKWFERWHSLSDDIFFIVNVVDGFRINAHCVLTIESYGPEKVVYCSQLVNDDKKSDFMDRCIEIQNQVADALNIKMMGATIEKHERAYARKYGYEVVRQIMIKRREDG